MPRRPRVYTTLVVALALVVLVPLCAPAPARAQVDVSIDPAMVKGAPAARVTIFEFSDYE